MPIGIYFDVHVPYAISLGLRSRDVKVLTAQEDGTRRFRDPILLDRATELGFALCTFDDDLLKEAHRRDLRGDHFSGIIFSQSRRPAFGRCITDIEIIAKSLDPKDLNNMIEYIPF